MCNKPGLGRSTSPCFPSTCNLRQSHRGWLLVVNSRGQVKWGGQFGGLKAKGLRWLVKANWLVIYSLPEILKQLSLPVIPFCPWTPGVLKPSLGYQSGQGAISWRQQRAASSHWIEPSPGDAKAVVNRASFKTSWDHVVFHGSKKARCFYEYPWNW